jgi:hypothetical protein
VLGVEADETAVLLALGADEVPTEVQPLRASELKAKRASKSFEVNVFVFINNNP